MGIGEPKMPTPEELTEQNINEEKKIKFGDLYRYADDSARYDKSLEELKTVAKHISLKLYELGITEMPTESKLGQAYIDASKIHESYDDLKEAQSAIKRIASLIYESDEFKNEEERLKQNQ